MRNQKILDPMGPWGKRFLYVRSRSKTEASAAVEAALGKSPDPNLGFSKKSTDTALPQEETSISVSVYVKLKQVFLAFRQG